MAHDNNKKVTNGRITTPLTGRSMKQGPNFPPRLAGASISALPTVTQRERLALAVRTPRGSSQDEVTTPIKPILSPNVTPRSNSRRARVGSASSTPSGTPNGTPASSRPTSMLAAKESSPLETRLDNGFGMKGVPFSGLSPVVVPNGGSITTSGGPATEIIGGGNTDSSVPPMFFHASEAKLLPIKKGPLTTSTQPKAPAFVYTNGDEASSRKSTLTTMSTTDLKRPRVFRESATSTQLRSSPPITSLRVSPKQTPFPQKQRAGQTRSTSPLKEVETARRLPIVANGRARVITPPERILRAAVTPTSSVSSATHSEVVRRESLNGPRLTQTRHAKTQSVSSVELWPTRRKSVAISDSGSGSTPHSSPPFVAEPDPILSPTLSALSQAPRLAARQQPAPTSPLASPTRTLTANGESKVDQMNALAANARRERKVLDLEISNSSLLAINRTLEREMRKQTAELRRYRRLTSTGRLSLLPSSNRSSHFRTSGMSATTDEDGSELSDYNGEAFPDLDHLSDESSISIEALSPTAKAAHDARQRARDEKHLQLDLSKHRELLLDSQKMNQSLKHCLDKTEEMIVEGKKALAYKVRVSDFAAVGGRVLAEDEFEEEAFERRRGLLSPAHDTMLSNPWVKEFEIPADGGSEVIIDEEDNLPGLHRENAALEMYLDELEMRVT